MGWARLLVGLTVQSVASPALARDLLRLAWRFRARRWFARWPFLPLPSRQYMRWRLYTAYGNDGVVPPIRDVVRYARWAGRRR